MMTITRTICLAAILAVASIGLCADGAAPKGNSNEAYPLSKELVVLERDLTSADYQVVLAKMIPTDLEAEWQRVAAPDNYFAFAEQHGGAKAVSADPALKAAYDRRVRIADGFLILMRETYKKRARKAPFDNPGKLDALLAKSVEQSARKGTSQSLSVAVVMPAEGAERQWPRLRGPTGQGIALDSQLPLHWGPKQNVVWKVDIPGKGNSSPVVWDDHLYITAAAKDGSGRKILCYSRRDGRLVWSYDAPQASAKESLFTKNTFASSTAVTDGKLLIVFFGNSGLVCVDRDGHPQWQVDLGVFKTMHGPGSSPVLYKDKVICIQYQSRGTSLFAAFDKRTGKKVWSHEKENAMCWSTPVVLHIGDHDELVFNGSNQLVGYDPDTGNEVWHVTGTSHEAIPTVVVGDGLLFSASGRNGPMMAVRPGGKGDVTETHVVWRNLLGGPHVPSPAYYKNRLFIVSDMGIATCLNASDGRTVWQNRLRGQFSMSPIESDGRLLVTSEEGRSFIFRAADKFELLADNDLEEPVLATPALLGGRLYFRSADHLWCIGPAGTVTASQ